MIPNYLPWRYVPTLYSMTPRIVDDFGTLVATDYGFLAVYLCDQFESIPAALESSQVNIVYFLASRMSPEGRPIETEHATADEAAREVEAIGQGSVTKFQRVRNLPDRLPEWESKSCAYWSLQPLRGWRRHNIWNGWGEAIGTERPQ